MPSAWPLKLSTSVTEAARVGHEIHRPALTRTARQGQWDARFRVGAGSIGDGEPIDQLPGTRGASSSAMRIPVRETAIGRRSDELMSRSAHGYAPAMWVALGHLGLGDLESLFQSLRAGNLTNP